MTLRLKPQRQALNKDSPKTTKSSFQRLPFELLSVTRAVKNH